MTEPDLAEVGAALAQRLHDAGVAATPDRTSRFVRTLEVGRPVDTDELYWMGRVTLASGRAEIDIYDEVFATVFGTSATSARSSRWSDPTPEVVALAVPEDDRSEGEGISSEGPPVTLAAASPEEVLRHKDFGQWTDDERDRLAALIEALAVVAPTRPGRRRVRAHQGRRLDVRATLRASHRTGGDPVGLERRGRKERRRRIVLLADVSGSMEPYSRAYVHLLHGAVRSTRAEAFVFATRLTRLTRELQVSDPDEALARAAAAAPDWSGGTRIGAALGRFNDDHGRRGLARGAVVVIVSDGWERDDPALLGEQMARLSRLAHRVIWVNPRSASEGFEPLAGGMAAALPHADDFVSGHSVAAMEFLLKTMATRSPHRPVRGGGRGEPAGWRMAGRDGG